jgi:hypothetical protein
MESPFGEMSMAVSFAAVTVRLADPLTVPDVAVMEADPEATPVARPVTSTEAMLLALELQTTLLVRSVELPSEKMPFAVKACVSPLWQTRSRQLS